MREAVANIVAGIMVGLFCGWAVTLAEGVLR
jgi:F0F1-type ATP synthase assembly protein I